MNLKITIMGDCITDDDIIKLNEISSDCYYSKILHRGLALPPEIVMIVIELLQNIGYSAAYDLIKVSVLSIVSKISNSLKKEIRVIVINGDKRSEIILPFDVTEEQKNKLVDAAIEKWRR